MPTFRWWIDEAMRTLNDFELRALALRVSLLKENKHRARYDKNSAQDVGWSIYSTPIEEGRAPSLDQIHDFTARLAALPEETKVLVFCDSGLGRRSTVNRLWDWLANGEGNFALRTFSPRMIVNVLALDGFYLFVGSLA